MESRSEWIRIEIEMAISHNIFDLLSKKIEIEGKSRDSILKDQDISILF